MSSKVWFITGASRGFGRIWTEAALRRGDRVAATARDISSLQPLVEAYGEAMLPLSLDVNDREAVFRAVATAHDHFDALDVVVSNAGYGLFGAVEEASEAQVRALMETNFFGSVWVLQAAIPYLRQRRGGHLLVVSSLGGIVTLPMGSIYAASKWALEGLCEGLAREISQFNIKLTLVEPAGYDTDWRRGSAQRTEHLAAYDGLRATRSTHASQRVLGDPTATSPAILRLVDTEAPPLRLLLGASALETAEKAYFDRLRGWRDWEAVTKAAQDCISAAAFATLLET